MEIFGEKKDHIKLLSLPKFEVVSLDCNHVEGFQKSEKLETLHGFWGPLTGHSLVTTQCNITKLGILTNFYVIFVVVGFISSYDAI